MVRFKYPPGKRVKFDKSDRSLIDRYIKCKTHRLRARIAAELEKNGYWLMARPPELTEAQMAKISDTKIHRECKYVAEFACNDLPIPGFKMDLRRIIAVYVEQA